MALRSAYLSLPWAARSFFEPRKAREHTESLFGLTGKKQKEKKFYVEATRHRWPGALLSTLCVKNNSVFSVCVFKFAIHRWRA